MERQWMRMRELRKMKASKNAGCRNSPFTVNLILSEKATVKSEENIDSIAARKMEDAIKDATYDSEQKVWGNKPGQDILETMKAIHQELAVEKGERVTETSTMKNDHSKDMAGMRKDHSKEMADMKKHYAGEMAELRKHISGLQKYSEGYRKIRHRRIDKFILQTTQNVGKLDSNRIRRGNEAAHDGDAITDADLYTSGERTDEHALIKLYGLTAREITALEEGGHPDTIKVLNRWSTMVTFSHGEAFLPAKFTSAFHKFITLLKRDLTARPDDGSTELGMACAKFWDVRKDLLK